MTTGLSHDWFGARVRVHVIFRIGVRGRIGVWVRVSFRVWDHLGQYWTSYVNHNWFGDQLWYGSLK